MKLNSNLVRQMKKSGVELENLGPELHNFIEKINNSYIDFDQNRYMYERLIKISSDEMKELRDHLQTERQYLQSIMSEEICILDENHKIKSVNREYCRLFNKSDEDFVGCLFSNSIHILDFISHNPIDITSVCDKLKIGLEMSTNRALLCINQQMHPVRFSAYPLPTKKKNLYAGAVIVLRDIKHTVENEKSLEVALEKANKSNQEKSIFLANMSHEIRSPMHGILGMLESIKNTALNDEQSNKINLCLRATTNLLLIINDILDISKLEAGKTNFEKIPFNFYDEINNIYDTVKFQSEEKNINIKFKTDKNIPKIIISDPLKIRQIISNLISNSLKFTPKYGKILLSSEFVTHVSKSYLKISISDTGVGIDSKNHKKIFESFSQEDSTTTRKFGGTGLGLSICKQFAENMGGWIRVESSPGNGSIFTFQIEIQTDDENLDPSIKKNIKSKTELSLPHAKILVVEDNMINQEVIKCMLEQYGCQSTFANNGCEAIDILDKSHFDLIFMDCQMPEMDGYTASNIIRNKENSLKIDKNSPQYQKIVALTANAFESDRLKCLEAGMDDFLSKPFTGEQLKSILTTYLSKH